MDFSALLKGLRNLDEKTIVHFINQYSALIRTFIRKKVHANDVEDATQEFLYHILRVNLFEKFAGETEDAFKAYLVKSALNFSFDWRKKELKVNDPLEIFDAANPNHLSALKSVDIVYEAFLEKETTEGLNAAVARLGAQYRRVIEFKLLGYSNVEIAKILDEPIGTVNSWYTRAIRMLGDTLKELHTTGEKSGVIK